MGELVGVLHYKVGGKKLAQKLVRTKINETNVEKLKGYSV
jgi:hypothetical protein